MIVWEGPARHRSGVMVCPVVFDGTEQGARHARSKSGQRCWRNGTFCGHWATRAAGLIRYDAAPRIARPEHFRPDIRPRFYRCRLRAKQVEAMGSTMRRSSLQPDSPVGAG